MHSVAPGQSDEGVKTFKTIASVESFSDRMQQDNTILVCEENQRIIGVVELKEGRHLAMLFVSPDCQERGVGRSLVSAIIPCTRAETLTVNASLNSVSAYSRYGFICEGDIAEKSGLEYQPMKLKHI